MTCLFNFKLIQDQTENREKKRIQYNKKDGYRQRNVRQFLQSAFFYRQTLATSRESRRYVVAFTRFAGGSIWLRQESLRLMLASPGYAPETIAVNVTRLERGFNACKTPRCMCIYLQPFLRHSKLLVENCDIFILHFCLAAPHGVTPSEYRKDLDIHKTRMNGLSCGEESMTICSAVLIQYQRVTDRQTDGRAKTCFSIADARKNI